MSYLLCGKLIFWGGLFRIQSMLKPSKKFFMLLEITLDLAFVFLSVYCTFWLRVRLNPHFVKQFQMYGISQYVPPIYLIVFLYIFVFYYLGLYQFSKRETLLDVFFQIIKGATIVIAALMLIAFLFRAENYSRSMILILWGVSIVALNLSHILGVSVLKLSKGSGIGIERIAFIGLNDKTRNLSRKIERMRNSIYNVVGYIKSGAEEENGIEGETSLIDLGKIADLVDIINNCMIDRIVVSESSLSPQELYQLMQICKKMDVHLDHIPDILTIADSKIKFSEIDGILLVSYSKPGFSRWDVALKRFFDLVISGLALLLLLPLIGLISLLIKLDSKGPVIFKQKRVGKGGKSFFMYKFRSMVADAEKSRQLLKEQNEMDGYLFKIKNDPRVTRIGKLMRKTSFDEIPSLVNVLLGEMSLVGPRPLPYADMQNELEDPRFRFWSEKRTDVAPGVTGLWQTSGRSNLGFEDMIKLDIFYIENWSLLLDVKILLKSIPYVLSGKGAF